tara:strand:+ start:12021 stop:12509 length:489 start_codon:yes stop_codon:yes gene_type:complete
MATTKGETAKAKTSARIAKPVAAKEDTQPGAIASVRNRVPSPDMKPTIVAVPPISVVTASGEGEASAPVVMKKPDLIDRVVERSGEKKRYVKPILEAALAVLGEALSKGEELNLQPLGRVKVNRHRVDEDAEMLILKLRRNTKVTDASDEAKETLADTGEDD